MTETVTSSVLSWIPHLPLPERVANAWAQNQLAVHIREEREGSGLSNEAVNYLEENTRENSLARLADDRMLPLFSMTHMPHGIKVDVWSGGNSGYLVDLSPHQENAPRIIAATTRVIDTGEYKNKYLTPDRLTRGWLSPEIQTCFDQRRRGQGDILWDLRRIAAGADGVNRGQAQLQWLSNYYRQAGKDPNHQFPSNEVIAAVSMPHIAALTVPLNLYNDFPQARRWLHSLCLVEGAVSYLQHYARGYDLPLVAYDPNQPADQMFYGLAYTPRQAVELANRARQEILECGIDGIGKSLFDALDGIMQDTTIKACLAKSTAAATEATPSARPSLPDRVQPSAKRRGGPSIAPIIK